MKVNLSVQEKQRQNLLEQLLLLLIFNWLVTAIFVVVCTWFCPKLLSCSVSCQILPKREKSKRRQTTYPLRKQISENFINSYLVFKKTPLHCHNTPPIVYVISYQVLAESCCLLSSNNLGLQPRVKLNRIYRLAMFLLRCSGLEIRRQNSDSPSECFDYSQTQNLCVSGSSFMCIICYPLQSATIYLPFFFPLP